jgi:uncharacterized OB-fold protein
VPTQFVNVWRGLIHVRNAIPDKLRPIPVPDALTQGYWDAAKSEVLAIQHCQECGYYSHPPKAECPECGGTDLPYEPMSGRGSVYTYTIVQDTRIKRFEPSLPYVVAQVELAEQAGLRVTCNLTGTDPDDVKTGLAVEVMFLKIGDGMVLPDFRPVKASS